MNLNPDYRYAVVPTSVNVVDGDTVDLTLDLGFHLTMRGRFRMAGIDTPERGRPGYQEARDALDDLLWNPEVRSHLVAVTTKADKYGRYLVTLWDASDPEAVSVNQQMLDLGHAKPYDGGRR